MKKRSIFLILLALVLGLAACGTQAPAPDAASGETISIVVPETIPETEPPATQPVQEIEITLENWEAYFEKRESQFVRVNNAGEITLREFGYGIFLKEEYASRLAQTDPVEVTFEIQADSVRYQVYGDLTTNNFIIRDDVVHNEGTQILSAQVEDHRGNDRIQADSDFHNAVAAFFTIDGEFGA